MLPWYCGAMKFASARPAPTDSSASTKVGRQMAQTESRSAYKTEIKLSLAMLAKVIAVATPTAIGSAT